MPGQSVVFYAILSEFFPVAYKLVEKMYSIGERVLFLCDNEEEVGFYNSKLWTTSKLSFIPSGNKSTITIDDAKFCYVWFSTEITFANEPTCLLHNGLDVCRFDRVERFRKIVDIFLIDSLESAKPRSAWYKAKGFEDQKLWIQTDSSWKQGSLL